ncbi:hypothetical protein [Paraherbaspirillum soli]|uniref:Uncharacterized protein n=1 Tax=Paraherbaspirillum soli TaxID=631222 RepID=A0ABW0M6A7_9BURK
MNTLTIAQTLPCRAECDLVIWAKRIGAAIFAVTVTALEAWLRFPIRSLFDGYLQSATSRISSVAASVFHHRSL